MSARAGYCEECGEDNWLVDGGGCVRGHDPRSVQTARVVPLPAELDHFNWGAFFWPVLWPLIQGPQTWALIFFGGSLLLRFVSWSTRATLPIAGPIAGLAYFAAMIWYARNANRLMWEWHPERVDVAGLGRKERNWAIAGLIVLAFFVALAALGFYLFARDAIH